MREDLWPSKLDRYLRAASKRSFSWGEWDCALFIFDAAKELTGEDHTQSWRGKYKTAAGALKQIKKHKVENLGGWLDKFYGRIPPSFAQRGDIVCRDQDELGAFGVVIGRDALFLTEEGTEKRAVLECDYAWRVE